MSIYKQCGHILRPFREKWSCVTKSESAVLKFIALNEMAQGGKPNSYVIALIFTNYAMVRPELFSN